MAVPVGKGVYIRDDLAHPPIEAVRWCQDTHTTWAAVNFLYRSAMAALRAAGIEVWVFALPDRLIPPHWDATLRACTDAAEAGGCAGLLLDPEAGWFPGREATRFGNALTGLLQRPGNRLGLGITTNAGHRVLAAQWAQQLGPLGAWISPQIYDHSRGDPPNLRHAEVPAWQAQRWAGVVPSIGVIVDRGHDDLGDAYFEAYFRALPRWRSAILWPRRPAYTGRKRQAVADLWQTGR